MAITYNGTPFAGQPVPFVKLGSEYVYDGDKRIERKVLSLSGELLACTKAELITAREIVFTAFQTRASITIDGLGTYEVENVLSVNFSDSPYFSKLPYTINLQIKDLSTVIDHEVEVSFDEQKDQTLTITRQITARGKSKDGSVATAYANAKAYITTEAAKTLPTPISIDSKAYNYFLVSSTESIDRINASISLTQTFRCDLFYSVSSILSQTITVERTQGATPIIKVNGEIEYRRETGYATPMSVYALNRGVNSFLVAELGSDIANYRITKENFSIDDHGGKINFSYDIENVGGVSNIGGFANDFKIGLDESGDSSLIRVKIDGVFRIPAGNFSSSLRAALLTAFQSQVINNDFMFANANAIYRVFHDLSDGLTISLKNDPLSYSYSITKDGTAIVWNASFDDRYILDGIKMFDYKIDVKPAIEKKQFSPSINGGYYILEFGYNTRAEAVVNVTTIKCDDDLDFNQLTMAEFLLREFISLNDAAPAKVVIKEKSSSADNSNRFSCSVGATYKGEKFEL